MGLDTPILAWSRARSAGYLLEYLVMNRLAASLPGPLSAKSRKFDPKIALRVRGDLDDLLARDSRNIAAGIYPLSVLKPESPIKHLLRLPRLVADGVALQIRRSKGRTTVFSRHARKLMDGLPRYYQRNFHFQTDGYLTDRSAQLYDHQVEMLFGGAADAMRRMILPPMRGALASRDGKGKTILEIGAGAGSATRFVRLAFPKAKIIATDLSPAYLREARRRLEDFPKTEFLQSPAEKLPFRDGEFDAVFSVFLFHELPIETRRQVLAESRRVLKGGGFVGLVDSLQTGDNPEFDPLLDQFPEDFHEPFFRNYLGHPMQDLLKDAGFEQIHSDRGFFSKVCWASAPERRQ